MVYGGNHSVVKWECDVTSHFGTVSLNNDSNYDPLLIFENINGHINLM